MSSKRILLVTTSSSWGQRMTACLVAQGYTVRAAADANEAWRCMVVEACHAVIIDAAPSCHEACLASRVLRDRFSIPIMVIGTSNDVQVRLNSYRAGADAYLSVPYDDQELSARLHGLLRRQDNGAQCTNSHAAPRHAWAPG